MAKKNVLLVEGLDDIKVIGELLEHHKVPETFAIKQKGGDSNLKAEAFQHLLDTLDTEIDGSGLEKLGIVIDADVDLSSRWQSLSQLLLNIGYESVPKTPMPQGTIITQTDRPMVGIWLMPDNQLLCRSTGATSQEQRTKSHREGQSCLSSRRNGPWSCRRHHYGLPCCAAVEGVSGCLGGRGINVPTVRLSSVKY